MGAVRRTHGGRKEIHLGVPDHRYRLVLKVTSSAVEKLSAFDVSLPRPEILIYATHKFGIYLAI